MDKNLTTKLCKLFCRNKLWNGNVFQIISGNWKFCSRITYLNYGSFTEADASGIITGNFSAAEYAFSLIYSREIDSLFSVGVNFKPYYLILKNILHLVLHLISEHHGITTAICFQPDWLLRILDTRLPHMPENRIRNCLLKYRQVFHKGWLMHRSGSH